LIAVPKQVVQVLWQQYFSELKTRLPLQVRQLLIKGPLHVKQVGLQQ